MLALFVPPSGQVRYKCCDPSGAPQPHPSPFSKHRGWPRATVLAGTPGSASPGSSQRALLTAPHGSLREPQDRDPVGNFPEQEHCDRVGCGSHGGCFVVLRALFIKSSWMDPVTQVADPCFFGLKALKLEEPWLFP